MALSRSGAAHVKVRYEYALLAGRVAAAQDDAILQVDARDPSVGRGFSCCAWRVTISMNVMFDDAWLLWV